MVVCKFFQQGYCRYAQNCRFEHIYGSKYTYNANPSQQNVQSSVDEQLLNQVHSDVNAVLKGGQWILSCYAPFKEKPTLPGLVDLSPEEARLFIYESKTNNTVDQAVTHLNNLFKEARLKHEQLLQNTPSLTKVLKSLYKGETVTSPFTNNQNAFGGSSNNAASSIFRSAVQSTSRFGQNPGNASSIFSQNPATSHDSTAKSIFAQASQNIFGSSQPFGSMQSQNVFTSNQASNQNIFGSNQNSGSVFGTDNVSAKSIFAQATQNTFGTNQSTQNSSSIFANASQQYFGPNQNQNSSPFGQTQNSSPFAVTSNNQSSPFSNANNTIFQRTNVFGVSTTNKPGKTYAEGIYSKIEDLSKEDLEAFESEEFTLGFIPEIAPPSQLCSSA